MPIFNNYDHSIILKSVNTAGNQNFLPISIYHLKVCNGCLSPLPTSINHRNLVCPHFALSSSSKYDFSKQPSHSEVYSTHTDNAMSMNPHDIDNSHHGMATIS